MAFIFQIILPPGSSLKLEVVLSAPNAEAIIAGSLNFYTNFEVRYHSKQYSLCSCPCYSETKWKRTTTKYSLESSPKYLLFMLKLAKIDRICLYPGNTGVKFLSLVDFFGFSKE